MAVFRASPSLVRALRPAPPRTLAVPRLHQQIFRQTAAVTRFSTLGARYDKKDPSKSSSIDLEEERRIAQQKIESDPSKVSLESSTRQVFENYKQPGQDAVDVNDGIKHDLGLVRDTFPLSEIPRESRLLGLAGSIPYVATSISTLALGWDLAKTYPTSSGIANFLFVNHEQARYYIDLLEPIQLGYGAVIISFLGAIHWGLEYAEKSPLPERSRFRYTMGVAAPAVAWPTLYLPIEYGLTAQFAAFVGMYFVDSRACKRGWTPPWYGQYRFLLTAMVGLAMFISLVGRAEIEKSNRLSTEYLRTSMGRPGIADTETDWVKVEAEDKKKAKEEQEKKEKEAKKGKKQEKGGKDEKKGDEKDEKKPDDGEDGKKQEDSKDDKKGDEKDEKKDDKQDKDEKDDKKDEKKDDKDDKKDEKKDDKDTE